MLLAFVPLFFAVASLARATVPGAREQSARVLGRAIAAHVADATGRAPATRAVERALEGHAGWDAVDAICVFAPRRGAPRVRRIAAGRGGDARTAAGERRVGDAGARRRRQGARRGVARGRRARGDAGAPRRRGRAGASLVRLVALYMVTFALALLVFAYFALTRLIVRPVEQLVDAADRVASGARTLRVPRAGARELIELGTSVQSMAEKLIAEEAKLLLKVEELTETTTRLHAGAGAARAQRADGERRVGSRRAWRTRSATPSRPSWACTTCSLDGDLPAGDAARLPAADAQGDRPHPHGPARPARLRAARGEGGAGAARRRRPADVRSVVADVVALVGTQKAFRDVRVESDIEGAPARRPPGAAPHAGAAEPRPQRGRGGRGRPKRDGGRVTVRARAQGDRVRIEVEDDGPGVDAGGARPPLRAVRDDQGRRRGHGPRARGLPRARRVGRRRDRARRDLHGRRALRA